MLTAENALCLTQKFVHVLLSLTGPGKQGLARRVGGGVDALLCREQLLTVLTSESFLGAYSRRTSARPSSTKPHPSLATEAPYKPH